MLVVTLELRGSWPELHRARYKARTFPVMSTIVVGELFVKVGGVELSVKTMRALGHSSRLIGRCLDFAVVV